MGLVLLAENILNMLTPNPIVVVMPVARMDWHLAVKCISWMKLIAKRDELIDVVLLCSEKLAPDHVQRLVDVGASPHLQIRTFLPEGIDESLGYGSAPNFIIKAALELMEKEYAGRAMLWMEADCVPMRAGWLEDIRREYEACGKPFMGDHVLRTQIPHMTGVAVYPPNWRELAPSLAEAYLKPKWGWDSQCAHETLPKSHRSKMIKQVWRPRPFTEQNWRGVIGDEPALFHQCKDGTLIHALGCGLDFPQEEPLEKSTYDEVFPSPEQRPESSAPVNVNVAILMVTYAKDVEFAKYSLRSIKKYAKGFAGVTLVVPRTDRVAFQWAQDESLVAQIIVFDEVPGKGMLHHEVLVCMADQLCPTADAILHVDADTMAWKPFTPEDYAPRGLPLLVRELYEECGKRNTNRLIWQGVVEKAIGLRPDWETMVRHPQIHLRDVYRVTREMVERHTGKKFSDYVLSCQNAFPQGFAEYPTLGAVALEHFRGHYTLVDYDHDRDGRECALPAGTNFQYIYRRDRDKFVEFWSHGGIAPYENWARNFLNGQIPAYHVK